MSEPTDNNKNNSSSEKGKRIAKPVLIFAAVFVILFCAVYFGIQLYNDYLADRPVATEPVSDNSDKSTSENASVENPVDFDALKKMNEDIYAYIKIEDTNVDYPIVQSPADDSFYLKHKAEDKSWSASGAIYTELVNNKNFNDRVTVIYGHNGYGDNYFTPLHKFSNKDFFNSHPYFYIYTPERKLTYQVISAFKYDDRHIMNSFNFADDDELGDFQQFLLNPSSASKNVRAQLDAQLDENSKIVVLSTCITNQKSSRYLVCGVLVKNEKTY